MFTVGHENYPHLKADDRNSHYFQPPLMVDGTKKTPLLLVDSLKFKVFDGCRLTMARSGPQLSKTTTQPACSK